MITVIVSGIGLFHYYYFPQRSNSLLAGISGLANNGHGLYHHKDLNFQTKDSIKSIIEISDARIKEFWYQKLSDPIIIYCSDSIDFLKYGAPISTIPAVTHLTPLGAFVVINGSLGLNTDVISHELCHAELLERVGFLNKEFEIPVWFDEGLALMLDYRFSDLDAMYIKAVNKGSEKINLDELIGIEQFYSGTHDQIHMAYLCSGLEVREWYQSVGADGLLELIDQLNAGEDFNKSYHNLQK